MMHFYNRSHGSAFKGMPALWDIIYGYVCSKLQIFLLLLMGN
jgi:hypothetical protein